MGASEKPSFPKPPSFSSAPDMSAARISVPSFASAPDISELSASRYSDDEKETKKRKKYKKDHSPEPKQRRSRSPRRHRSRSPRRHRSRSPQRTSRSSKSHRHSRSPHRSRPHSRERRSRRSSPPAAFGELAGGITYVLDKKGDPNNLTYGSNHSYSVPAYHRSKGDIALGLLPIDTRGDKKKPRRYTDAEYSWRESDKSLKRIRIKHSASDNSDFLKDFIPLDVKTSIKSTQDGNDLATGERDYRSIASNALKGEESESDDEGENDAESFDEYIRRRTVEFNRKLAENPEDPDLWLAFIAFQDEAAKGLNTSNESKKHVKANKASLNDVKMSIFEKALDENPDSEDLILAYLKCGGELWDTPTLLKIWGQQLKRHPESIRLWADYINLRQTNFASFTFTDCIKDFESCIMTLNKKALRLQSHQKSSYNESCENIESLMTYVVLRACLFMKQSGYHERAFSTLQALVEFCLFRPKDISNQFDDLLEEFDDFWNSEVARFGETGALGWKSYYHAKQQGQDMDPIIETYDQVTPEMENLRDWVNAELQTEERHRLSLRMSSIQPSLIDEDPDLVTLSEDVKGYLFNITTDEARQTLIYGVFVFLGLPYTPPGVGTNTHFCTDTFTHNDLKLHNFWPRSEQQPKLVAYIDGVPMTPENTVNQQLPFELPIAYPIGVGELFSRQQRWFSCLGYQHLDFGTDADFTRNAFDQLGKIDTSDYLAICHLSFESSCNRERARQLAKDMLQRQPTNLALWNAYAQMEKSHSRLKAARKVYQTALASHRTLPSADKPDASLLYRMFAQLEVEDGCFNEALCILVSMADDSVIYKEDMPKPTRFQILKAKEYFAQRTAQLSTLTGSEKEMQHAHNYIVCRALFEYLSVGIEAACLIYESALTYIEERHAERGFESETLWIAYVELMYRHATGGHGGFRLKHFRETVERAMGLFPNNTIFMAMFTWNESRSRVLNRVRAYYSKALEVEPNVILWLSALHCELHHYHPYDVNQVRSLFERAVDSASTRSSIVLWKLYIEHEIRLGNYNRTKSLFYRAVRACPWSKELYLFGIQHLERAMSDEDMREVTRLMDEKEIRSHRMSEGLLATGE